MNLVFGIGFGLFVATLAVEPAPERAGGYRLGSGDVVHIEVWGESALSGDFRIDGEGALLLPLLGEVQVAGQEPAELATGLEQLFGRDYLRHPQVTVQVTEFAQTVQVFGEVNQPGSVPVSGQTTLLELLSAVGGTTEQAAQTLVLHRRGVDERVEIDLELLVDRGELRWNVPVGSGDVLYVPRGARVFVTGEVRNNGAYAVGEGLTLLQAISLAGGLTERAAPRRVQVVRSTEAGVVTLDFNVRQLQRGIGEDPLLQPGDQVVIPESAI